MFESSTRAPNGAATVGCSVGLFTGLGRSGITIVRESCVSEGTEQIPNYYYIAESGCFAKRLADDAESAGPSRSLSSTITDRAA